MNSIRSRSILKIKAQEEYEKSKFRKYPMKEAENILKNHKIRLR